jgi:hypothetical protein
MQLQMEALEEVAPDLAVVVSVLLEHKEIKARHPHLIQYQVGNMASMEVRGAKLTFQVEVEVPEQPEFQDHMQALALVTAVREEPMTF